jgi:hypothetical protein
VWALMLESMVKNASMKVGTLDGRWHLSRRVITPVLAQYPAILATSRATSSFPHQSFREASSVDDKGSYRINVPYQKFEAMSQRMIFP